MRRALCVFVAALLGGVTEAAGSQQADGIATRCAGLPRAFQLRQLLRQAAIPDNPLLSPSLRRGPGGVGGFLDGTIVWAAVVNRNGQLCAWITSTSDATVPKPFAQAAAKALAYTANATRLVLGHGSTANMYTLTQPGGYLWGIEKTNPFNPRFLLPPTDTTTGLGEITGGIITIGGGVPLHQGGEVIGGLGVAGDTPCADHEMAKRVRDLAGLNPPSGPGIDDIRYVEAGDEGDTHPLCPNTFRNEFPIE
jgi:uncharacterized protein GlcG (DUF336 family)